MAWHTDPSVISLRLSPQFAPVRRSWRALLALNRIFILRHVKAALVASKDIARQLRDLVGETGIDIADASSYLFTVAVRVYPITRHGITTAVPSFLRGPYRGQ